ncbi:hypothetical protein ACFSM7_11440 [Clavibacter michiganensis subsp. tessellarius]|uniref:hypothetical protein n=1 Tax=Clavibacter tessellarius TaxID=31965 RepID=UPI0036430F2D
MSHGRRDHVLGQGADTGCARATRALDGCRPGPAASDDRTAHAGGAGRLLGDPPLLCSRYRRSSGARQRVQGSPGRVQRRTDLRPPTFT